MSSREKALAREIKRALAASWTPSVKAEVVLGLAIELLRETDGTIATQQRVREAAECLLHDVFVGEMVDFDLW
jgi:hypothetical protein